MNPKVTNTSKKAQIKRNNYNPYESGTSDGGTSLGSVAKDTLKNTANAVADIGTGVFDQLLGITHPPVSRPESYRQDASQGGVNFEQMNQTYEEFSQERDVTASEYQFFQQRKREFDSYLEQESAKEQREIAETQEVIRREIEAFKVQQRQMEDNLMQLQKLAFDQSKAKGIYQIRFMELMVQILRNIRAQAAESNTWLEAMISRKKKRGSLFAVHSKDKGTQYSQSQELSLTRSTQ